MGNTPLKFRDLRRILEKNGFVLDDVKGGPHHHFVKNGLKLIVPYHGGKDLAKGTVLSILKEAGLR